MNISCVVCEKKFIINSKEQLDVFCSHVSNCPARRDTIHLARFTCAICKNIVIQKRSFKDHIIKNHFNKHELYEKSSNSAVKDDSRRNREITFDKRRELQEPITEECPEPEVIEAPIVLDHSEEQENHTDIISEFENSVLLIATRLFGRMNLSMDDAESTMKDIGNISDLIYSFNCHRVDSLFKDVESVKKDLVTSLLTSNNKRIKKCLKNVSTEQTLKTTLIKKHVMEVPTKKIFAEREEQVGTHLITVKSEAVVLPIEHQIKTFLEKDGVLQAILDHQEKLENDQSGLHKHFLTGEGWKKIKREYKEEIVVPLFLYNDDFGPDDGLGPHGSANKISGYYYSFPSMPPEAASAIDSIFVAMFAKTEDIKEQGPNKLLDLLVAEIEPLESRGVEVLGKVVHIVPVLLLGDNMGLNLNLGLQGYRGFYYCRFCYMVKAKMELCCKEDPTLLRTKEHYEEGLNALKAGEKTFYGLVFNTHLNKLKYFKFYLNYIVDIMHDLFTGVFEYGVTEILNLAITTEKFTLAQFNKVKNDFDYGEKDGEYIIEDITTAHVKNRSVRCHAREMMIFIKYLPAILSKLLPVNCALRKYGNILHNLLEMCMKNSYSEEDLEDLENEVMKHNKEFLRLFNTNKDRPLVPKAHHLLHYVRVIRNSGPLKFLWSMRFEAKHQQSKQYARVSHSRRNLCVSLAKKFSFHFAWKTLEKADVLKKVKIVRASHAKILVEDDNIKDFQCCISAKYKNTLYSVGDFIQSDCLNYAFKIVQIVANELDGKLMFIIKKFSISFKNAIKMYKIEDSDNILILKKVEDLKYPPVDSHEFDKAFYLKYEEF